MLYKDVQGMRKRAGEAISTLLGGAADTATAAGEITTRLAVGIIATAAAAGYGIGWGAAKLFAHGDRDMDTIRKGYENERLKTDIGYVGSQLKNELEMAKSNEPPKAAKVLI